MARQLPYARDRDYDAAHAPLPRTFNGLQRGIVRRQRYIHDSRILWRSIADMLPIVGMTEPSSTSHVLQATAGADRAYAYFKLPLGARITAWRLYCYEATAAAFTGRLYRYTAFSGSAIAVGAVQSSPGTGVGDTYLEETGLAVDIADANVYYIDWLAAAGGDQVRSLRIEAEVP